MLTNEKPCYVLLKNFSGIKILKLSIYVSARRWRVMVSCTDEIRGVRKEKCIENIITPSNWSSILMIM